MLFLNPVCVVLSPFPLSFSLSQLLDETLKAARTVASFSRPVIETAKEAVNVAGETTLAEGLRFERRAFWAGFALADQKEGMGAFVDKRKPEWKHE